MSKHIYTIIFLGSVLSAILAFANRFTGDLQEAIWYLLLAIIGLIVLPYEKR